MSLLRNKLPAACVDTIFEFDPTYRDKFSGLIKSNAFTTELWARWCRRLVASAGVTGDFKERLSAALEHCAPRGPAFPREIRVRNIGCKLYFRDGQFRAVNRTVDGLYYDLWVKQKFEVSMEYEDGYCANFRFFVFNQKDYHDTVVYEDCYGYTCRYGNYFVAETYDDYFLPEDRMII